MPEDEWWVVSIPEREVALRGCFESWFERLLW
jgi:hypothetical protein